MYNLSAYQILGCLLLHQCVDNNSNSLPSVRMFVYVNSHNHPLCLMAIVVGRFNNLCIAGTQVDGLLWIVESQRSYSFHITDFEKDLSCLATNKIDTNKVQLVSLDEHVNTIEGIDQLTANTRTAILGICDHWPVNPFEGLFQQEYCVISAYMVN